MQYISARPVRIIQPPPVLALVAKQPQRLEPESKEETEIVNLERKIGEARRNGSPLDSLIHERQRIYDSWIGRLDRELSDDKITGQDRERLERQRQRATRDY